jgi:glycosyltransferase involved in cell wall biosynthesis
MLHVPHYNIPVLYKGAIIVTIHDLNHMIYPEFLPNMAARWYARFLLRQAVKRSVYIITDSEHTKHDMMKLLGVPEEKIRVIYLGLHPAFKQPVSPDGIAAIRVKYNLPPRFILYVGNVRLIKNIPRLVEAYRFFKKKTAEQCPLVLVGKNNLPWSYWKMHAGDSILVKNSVPFEDLPAVYKAAHMFVFPSLYEGFGLPPLEAMASGIPVIASNGGSLPEILGDAALLVHPHDVSGLADAMTALMHDESLRASLIAKGTHRVLRYTWQESARQHIKIYEELMA